MFYLFITITNSIQKIVLLLVLLLVVVPEHKNKNAMIVYFSVVFFGVSAPTQHTSERQRKTKKKLFQTKKDIDIHDGKRSEHTKNGGTAVAFQFVIENAIRKAFSWNLHRRKFVIASFFFFSNSHRRSSFNFLLLSPSHNGCRLSSRWISKTRTFWRRSIEERLEEDDEFDPTGKDVIHRPFKVEVDGDIGT